MKIVLIDDDCALNRSLDIVLSARGHHLVPFCDPEEACSCLAAETEVDVVLLDYVMPGLSGIEVLERVGASLPQGCRVIVISGHTDLVDTKRLARVGVSTFLPKPIDVEELLRLIESVPSEQSAATRSAEGSH